MNNLHDAKQFVSNKSRLILSSFLMLFVEMTLIRWTSSNVYSIFYFTNFILIASFLGIGIGFLRHKNVKEYFYLSPILLSIVILFCYLYHYEYQVKVNPHTGNLDYYASVAKDRIYPVFLTLPIIFMAVTVTMASIADSVARSFVIFPCLQAYRLEVLGTLFGIAAFTGLAWLGLPPLAWGVVISLTYVILCWRSWQTHHGILMLLQISALVLMTGILYKETMTKNHIWSTYYKIQIKPFSPNSYVVNVNGLAQQVIESVEQRKKIKPFYIKPYEHMTKANTLKNVLVIGAGTGGDVAIALAEGAKHVDAVEIDRKLYELGKKLNPNKPYDDPRVSVFINDGRAFLQQTAHHYDLIIYALTDSLMIIPGQSSMRLENYLYTTEGLTAAANHLQVNGIFTIYNYYGVKWFADRLANTLRNVYHHSPCIDTYSADDYWATVLTVSANEKSLQCSTHWQSSSQMSEQPATDNHPFIYLQNNTMPVIYLFALIFVCLITYFSIKISGVRISAIRSYFDLFLMGAAFLLLETKSVVSFALLFGTTWIVNSLVFIGILLSVYFAIEVTARINKMNVYFLYAVLSLSLVIAWIVPMSHLLLFSPMMRFVLAAAITFTPIFIANLIFADRLQDANLSTDAFGANLIGAVLGGLLEYGSLIVGYQYFALIILAIYSAAFISLLLTRSHRELTTGWR